MDSDQQDSDFGLEIDDEVAKGLQEQLKTVAGKIYEERIKVVNNAIIQLLSKTECKVGDLRAFHFQDGREYIVTPSGHGFRIDIDCGSKETNYAVILKAVPVMMNEELKVLREGSK